MNISDNTLKLLKRAAKQDYSTPWKPISYDEPLATGTLARSFPALNTMEANISQNDNTEAANNAMFFGRDGTDRWYQPQYFPYHAVGNNYFNITKSRPMPF